MTSVYTPQTFDELLSLVAASTGRKKHFIAGGTDWIIKNNKNIVEGAALFDMSKMSDLKGIRATGSSLKLGALETMTSVCTDDLVRRFATALSDAAHSMGSVQIRNRATVGGNLANASPAADTPCALAALGAIVLTASPSRCRKLSVEEVLGSVPNVNTLSEDEIITGFEIPVEEDRISVFRKIGSRSEVSIARVNMAVSTIYENGVFSEARVFVGTLGLAAKRCFEAEHAILLPPASREQNFKDALCRLADAMIPGRSTLPYKKSALQALAEDILETLEKRRKVSEKSGERDNGNG